MRKKGMQSSHLRPALKTAAFALTILLLSAGVCFAQSTVSLTATRQSTTLPDGTTVPMWGWVCGTGTPVTAGGTGTNPASGATCTAMNGGAQVPGAAGSVSTTWQPPLITVPTGNSLQISLANNMPVATSLTIVGQLAGGLGSPVRESGPRTDGAHAGQTTTTWTTNLGGTFIPPAQGARARSFVAEAPATNGTSNGLQTYTWTALRLGTYLIETGTYPSIQGPMGLYGVLVVTAVPTQASTTTTPPTAFASGTAYSGTTSVGPYTIPYDADVPLLLSEIDPVQNAAADAAVLTTSFSETAAWTQQCGQAHTCYPAAVNFTPLYYLVNGISFDRTATTSSAVTIPASASTGNVLLRFVNASLRMHVPAVAGLNMSLIAEDGNVLPDVALAASHNNPLTVRVQSNVFLPAGKVYDVIVSPANNGNPAAAPPVAPTAYNTGSYQLFDRELSLSANGSRRDGGMQTTLLVAGGTSPATGDGYAAAAKANPDTYFLTPCHTITISDPGKGLAANDVNVYGVQVLAGHGPTGGTLTLNPDGTFVYVPNAGTTTDSFMYYANNNTLSAALQTTVTLAPCTGTCKGAAPTAANATFTSKVSSLIKVNPPGVLAFANDPTGYPLTAVLVGTPTGVTMNADGGFTAVLPGNTGAATATFNYQAVNSQGTPSNTATVTVTFQAGSGLNVTVQDAQSKVAISDYKWIIEQDLTFKVDPACQQNGPGGSKPATCPAGVVPSLGTNFHTSYMPVIAVGCTGPQSCERGQTVYDNRPTVPGTTPGTTVPNPTLGQHVT